MFKKEKDVKTPGYKAPNDGQAIIDALNAFKAEVNERLDDMEKRSGAAGEAQLLVAKRVFDTDRKHLPEMTVISLRMVHPLSLADACASILDEDVQEGRVTLGQIRRESIYRHLRSVKGNLLEKGSKLAEQQEVNKVEDKVAPWEVQGG